MAENNQKMAFLLLLVYESKMTIFASLIIGGIAGACSIGLIALITKIGNSSIDEHLFLFVGGFVALAMGRFFFDILSRILLIRLAQDFIFKLRLLLSRRIANLPLSRLEEIGIPRIMATLTDDILNISAAFNLVPMVCIDIAVVIACGIYIGYLSVEIMLISLFVIVIGMTIYQFLAKRGLYFFKLSRKKEDILFKDFETLTKGFKEIKLNAKRKEIFLDNFLGSTAKEYRDHNVEAYRLFAFANGLGHIFFFIPLGVVLFLLPSVKEISQQILWGYIIVVIYCIGPLTRITYFFPFFGRANIAADNIKSLELSISDRKKHDLQIVTAETEKLFSWNQVGANQG